MGSIGVPLARGCMILGAVVVLASCGGGDSGPAAVPVTPPASGAAPTATSMTAATSTATDNSLCTTIEPFYWEIGDKTGTLASGSQGTAAANDPILAPGAPALATTKFSYASASKWLYGMYVMQQLGSVAALTTTNVPFLNFTSGYTNMGDDSTSAECPSTDTPDTINTCLTQINPANNLPYNYNDPATVGSFDYDSGHLENYASLYGGIGDVDKLQLGPTIGAALAPNINIIYTEPLMAGGGFGSAADYATVLQNLLAGNLVMLDALGTNAVCTDKRVTGCNATFTPIPEAWHYSIAHWVEDDAATGGDGAFSSPGAFGFYPWVEAGKAYYGLVAREQSSGAPGQQGYQSVQCGRLIRKAWDSGVEQAGQIPQ